MDDVYMELMDLVTTVEKKILGIESLLSFMTIEYSGFHVPAVR